MESVVSTLLIRTGTSNACMHACCTAIMQAAPSPSQDVQQDKLTAAGQPLRLTYSKSHAMYVSLKFVVGFRDRARRVTPRVVMQSLASWTRPCLTISDPQTHAPLKPLYIFHILCLGLFLDQFRSSSLNINYHTVSDMSAENNNRQIFVGCQGFERRFFLQNVNKYFGGDVKVIIGVDMKTVSCLY